MVGFGRRFRVVRFIQLLQFRLLLGFEKIGSRAMSGLLWLSLLLISYDPFVPYDPYKDVFRVVHAAVQVPIHRFVLIRRSNDHCAILYLSFNDSSRKWVHSLETEYEWYFQGDGSGDFLSPTAINGRRRGTYYSREILGKLLYINGWNNAKALECGSFVLAGGKTPVVPFYPHDKSPWADYGIEIAPTRWRDIKEVNSSHPGLVWYRYDYDRKDILIPGDKAPPQDDTPRSHD